MSEGGRFLVDTSAWIETLRAEGDPKVRRRVSELTADDRVVLCDAVRLELWNGARSARDHRLLRELEEQLETVPTTSETWELARDLARSARGQGVTVPAADLLIAACAEQHGLGLLHHDIHFERLAKLRAKRP
ncbi:MAG TPA: PIN domain-containing protein [Thermoanaerobaculia bacterium]|nr:PIN domain-containing protein [Thermoanaerobaculia bacterium]